MRYLAIVAALLLTVSVAHAQQTTCKAQAAEKKLAGAAQKSFLAKCQKDAQTTCNKSAADQKLSGAAKTSHVKKCVNDAVGS
jgi:hypothetical protein